MFQNAATLRLSLRSPGQLAKIPGPSVAVRRSLVCPSCRCISARGGKRAGLGVVCFTLTPPEFGSMEGRDRRAGGAGVAEGLAQSLHAHMHQALDEWRTNISRARRWTVAVKSDLSQRLSRALINVPRHLAPPGNARGQYHIAPMFASISSAVTRRAHRPQPIGDVALGRDDIRSRLSAVPVFTVVNSKEEIVLVTGEGATDSPKQLGMFFFTRDDALAMVNRIKDYDESMGKDSRVVSVTLDTVYDLFIKPPQQLSKPSTMLRFIPHPPQVERALGVLSKEGVSKPSFGGVPLFQAENLVVTGKNGGKFVPLFFSKDDLDLAVASAFEQRMQAQIKELEVKARKYQAEADKARSLWAEADRKERKGLKEKADEEQRKAEEALEKAERVRRSSMPRVEVGSLEEVLVKMQEDGKGEFSSVMFVPIGTVQADAVADDGRSDGASGGKKAVNKSRKAAKA